MTDVDNKKPEAVKPTSDDSVAHALAVFARSLAYSAAEAPTRAGAQLFDHTFGTTLDDTVQAKFNNSGIHKPEETQFGTNAWKADQLGSGIGMVVPMWLARKAMVGKAESSLVARLEHTSLADKALREASLSAKTGFIYGAALTPTEEKNSTGNILLDRFKQGANAYATFGAMGYSSSLSSGLLGRTANSLESTALPAIFKSPLQTTLHSSFVHGAISGVPGGIIQAQLGAMESGKPLASLQDIKENVVSMSMVGGAMGSAGLFKEANALAKINLDIPAEKTLAKPLEITPSLTELTEHETPRADKTAHPFDIKFEPIKEAWLPEDVNKHMSVENRSIEFAPEKKAGQTDQKDWDKFHEWGIENRIVPVNVYRFPGVTAEIVVPSDYAKKLDLVREHRLGLDSNFPPDQVSANNVTETYARRILPEEIAQIIKQLPQPDLVKSVELLDHFSAWDVKRTHDRMVAAEAKGEVPGFKHTFISQADANIGSGTIRFFDHATHDAAEMQEAMAHEWAHLLEKNPAFKAFGQAAQVESKGFFTRDYARENNQENWAVHLGERLLNTDGAAFAELPEQAPARTLVMVKAVRNMLEERKDNPSPRHDQFLARIQAADDRATSNLQKGILADIASGDHAALAEKLKFLNIAATDGHSPELLTKVIAPIRDDLKPIREAMGAQGRSARIAYAETLTIEQVHNYSPEKMPALLRLWRSFEDSSSRTRLFKILPEDGQKAILDDLSTNASRGGRNMLVQLAEAQGPLQNVLEALKSAQDNFTKQGLRLFRVNQPVPEQYLNWLEHSPAPEARLAAMQNKEHTIGGPAFIDLTKDFKPQAMREMIVGDAMSYIRSEDRSGTWTAVLKDMPQSDQVELFRELGHRHDATYTILANKIEDMDATEFGASSRQIQSASLEIMKRRESTPEFIAANPRRIKDANSFMTAVGSLDSSQIAGLVKDGVLNNIPEQGIDTIVKGFSEKFDARAQLDILEAVPSSVESKARIDILSKMAKENDPVVSAKAERLLIDVADKQLAALREKTDTDSFISELALERFLLGVDDASARVTYLKSLKTEVNEHLPAAKATLAAFGLSEPQLMKFLRSGITDRLSANDQAQFLHGAFWGRSKEIKDQIRHMAEVSHLDGF